MRRLRQEGAETCACRVLFSATIGAEGRTTESEAGTEKRKPLIIRNILNSTCIQSGPKPSTCHSKLIVSLDFLGSLGFHRWRAWLPQYTMSSTSRPLSNNVGCWRMTRYIICSPWIHSKHFISSAITLASCAYLMAGVRPSAGICGARK